MNERDFVNYLRSRFEKPSSLVNKWMGEDCEVIDIGDPKKYLLVSVDTSSEKVDFPSDTPPKEMGFFSAALSLSDIAACGGTPLGILVSCSVSPALSEKMEEVYEGIGEAVASAGTFILGGDTNSAGEFSLSVVSLGFVEKGKLLERGKGNVGDLIGVTGELDRFNFGYWQIINGRAVDFVRMLKQPPATTAGRLLGELGATSCIDLPDGLIKATFDNLPNGLGCLIDDKAIPVEYFRGTMDADNIANYVLASEPAGDIELLFTISPRNRREMEVAFNNEGLPIHWIGRITQVPGIRINHNGKIVTPGISGGFVHKFDGGFLFK